jgi:hypothetical protein
MIEILRPLRMERYNMTWDDNVQRYIDMNCCDRALKTERDMIMSGLLHIEF